MILYKKIFHSYNLAMKASLLIAFYLFFSFSLEGSECNVTVPLKTFQPKFAKFFKIDYFKNFKIVHVNKDQYLLSDHLNLGCEFPMPQVRTPVKRVVMMSTTYLPALELLQVEKSLIAFQGKRYIVSPSFAQDIIQEVAFKFNPESLLGLKADLIMGYESNLSAPKQRQIFQSLKLPVVINKDFEETTPLGRAEWLIFTASFYNQEEKAQKIFNLISNDYLGLKYLNAKLTSRPKVLVGEIQNGYWVTAGGESDLGQMIADAGGEMLLKKASTATQKISLEELSQLKMPVEFWITHNSWNNHADLVGAQKKDSRYLLITAKNIYNNNLIKNKNMFLDYWERGMQRPDLVLADLTFLFHPNHLPKHKLQWYQKL